MTRNDLVREIKSKNSCLCVGLDPELSKLPVHYQKSSDSILDFNLKIIEATQQYCVAYKPNLAFYEALGSKGWDILHQTVHHISPSHFKIADAKRGDIGNTSSLYAKAFFKNMDFDAITVNPYMGIDSVKPFLEYSQKWVILLGLTSNEGSKDFQFIKNHDGKYLFEQVIETSSKWGNPDQIMFVIGATHPEYFEKIRKIVPQHFFLVPGIGAQGGDLESVFKAGANAEVGLLINSSRSIIYASSNEDFQEKSGRAAYDLTLEMKELIQKI